MRQDGVMQQPRNFSMTGAVDLGARQAAAKRRQQAAETGTGGESAFVFEVTEATFNTDVVARSQAAPVIVDLWAEWCEPCKQLGPVLEKLANEAAGDWLLAKVDVDANPQLSAALQVQSIPMLVRPAGAWRPVLRAAAAPRRGCPACRAPSAVPRRPGPLGPLGRPSCSATRGSTPRSRRWTRATSMRPLPRSVRCWPTRRSTRSPRRGWLRST